MASQIKLRRDTAANWASVNPVLASGEPGLETDTLKIKYGDGVHAWNILSYASGGGGGTTVANTFTGGTVTAITITTTTDATSQTTGALIVAGGAGIGGTLWSGEHYIQYDSSTNPGYPGGYDAGLFINNTGSSVTGITMQGKDNNRVFLAQSGGTLFVSAANYTADPTSSSNVMMVISPSNTYIAAATSATNATSGAFTVNGGAGIAGDLYVSGNIYSSNSQKVLTTASNYTVPFASTTTAGIIKVDPTSGISVSSSGTLIIGFAAASKTFPGVVQIGAGINVDSNGIISVTTGAFALQTATTAILGGVKIDGNTINISGTGTISVNTASLNIASFPSRTLASTTTVSLAPGQATTATISGYKGYALYSIYTSNGAWVTVYTNTASMVSDYGRSIAVDPVPGSGVVGEIIATTTGTTYFTPALVGYSAEATPNTNIPVKIYNNTNTTVAITVTLTLLKMEN